MLRSGTSCREWLAEIIGTYVLVFFGIGSVHTAVLTGAQAGIWQVAVVWGVAISLAIYAVSAVSGAHINPAITIAFVVHRRFPVRKAPMYVLSQMVGAVLAAGTLYVLFGNILRDFEAAAGIVRGQPGSELSAMVYGEYFPNPAIARSLNWAADSVSHLQAMLGEGIGTAFLAFFVFAVTEPRNSTGPGRRLLPLFIGLTVSIIICVIAPLTQAGLNPARDLGPRLFAYFAGWRSVAIPGPRGGFLTVYVLAPIVGGLVGSTAYRYVVRPGLPKKRGTAEQEIAMSATRVILVGGFLGAGKTTLLWEAARRLIAKGGRVGLITNDQAPDLVDTGLLARRGLEVREVAGSCFCCNFHGLIHAARDLSNGVQADILIAEPVGSCTDLSATILQPLKDRFADEFVLCPLSVLADPARLTEAMTGEVAAMHPSAGYIFRKQLEEADVIVVNKVDLLDASVRGELQALLDAQFPATEVRWISALTGQGVADWLEAVLASSRAGSRIADVDYDTYAEGEAVLGWLNAAIRLSRRGEEAVPWRAFCADLMARLQETFRGSRARVGHVKLLLSTHNGHCTGNLARTDGRVSIRGDIGQPSDEGELVLNARVEMAPQELEKIVRDSLAASAGSAIEVRIAQLRCLTPGRPQPTYRYDSVV
ncbi:MAG: MIP family channel protein [Phycisphaerae bacterium]